MYRLAESPLEKLGGGEKWVKRAGLVGQASIRKKIDRPLSLAHL